MTIQDCISEDVDTIYRLYEDARLLQTSKKMVVWPYFDKRFIERGIFEKRQWKIVVNGEITCTWTITFNDKEIWGSRDNDDAIYIHRIATNPKYRGNNYVRTIVDWARIYAVNNKRKYIRLDTLGNNTKLIQYYTKSGFTFLGIEKLMNTQGLPQHYHKEPNCCRFEIEI